MFEGLGILCELFGQELVEEACVMALRDYSKEQGDKELEEVLDKTLNLYRQKREEKESMDE